MKYSFEKNINKYEKNKFNTARKQLLILFLLFLLASSFI